MSTCMVYEAKLAEKVYIGCTQLTLADRLRSMKAKPVLWFRRESSLAALKLEPLHERRVSEPTALALEAAFSAIAWAETSGAARGGPYCLSRLHAPFLEELRALVTALEGQESMSEKVSAVRQVAATFARTSPLNRHLRGQCYKCGGKFRRCQCRSRNSGFHVLETPPKRSGKSLSGNRKRKARGWPATDDRYRQHKWPNDSRANEARNWNNKHPDRDRGKKK